MDKKRVSILSMSVGEGHRQAAQALKRAFLEKRPNLEISIADTTDFSFPWKKLYKDFYFFVINQKGTGKIYNSLYKGAHERKPSTYLGYKIVRRILLPSLKKVGKYIERFNPEVIITLHVFSCELIVLHSKKNQAGYKHLAIITDYVPHRLWVHSNVDQYYVANQEIKKYFQKKSIPSSKVLVTGIPVHPRFYASKKKMDMVHKLGLCKDRKTILILCTSSKLKKIGTLKRIISDLKDLDLPIQVLIVTARNTELKKDLEQIKKRSSLPIHIFGYADNMDELMSVADVLVSKPGGLIISEALAKKVPVILFDPIPGHEEENFEYLIKRKAAFSVDDPQMLAHKIKHILNSKDRISEIRANMAKIAKPKATYRIVEDIIDKFLK